MDTPNSRFDDALFDFLKDLEETNQKVDDINKNLEKININFENIEKQQQENFNQNKNEEIKVIKAERVNVPLLPKAISIQEQIKREAKTEETEDKKALLVPVKAEKEPVPNFPKPERMTTEETEGKKALPVPVRAIRNSDIPFLPKPEDLEKIFKTNEKENERKREEREKEIQEKRKEEEEKKRDEEFKNKLDDYFKAELDFKKKFLELQKSLNEEVKNLNKELSFKNKREEKKEFLELKKALKNAKSKEDFVKNHKFLSLVSEKGAKETLTKGVLALFSKKYREELKEDYEEILAQAEADVQKTEIEFAKKQTEINYKKEKNPEYIKLLKQLEAEKQKDLERIKQEKQQKLTQASSKEEQIKIEEEYTKQLEKIQQAYEENLKGIKEKYDKTLERELQKIETSIIEKYNKKTQFDEAEPVKAEKENIVEARKETAREIVDEKKEKQEEKAVREETLQTLKEINKNQEAQKELQEKAFKKQEEELKEDKKLIKAVKNIDEEGAGAGGGSLLDLFKGGKRKLGKLGKLLSKGKGLLKVGGSLLRGAGNLLKVGRVASMAAGLVGEGGALTGAVTALATNPVGWAIGGALAIGAAGVGIYHLMIDDDSEAIMDKLEKSGAVEHNFFGNSEIKDWSQIYVLPKKDLDALARFDDWSDGTLKTLKVLQKIKMPTRQFLASMIRQQIVEADNDGILTIDYLDKFSKALKQALKDKTFIFSNDLKEIFNKEDFKFIKQLVNNFNKKAKKEKSTNNKTDNKVKEVEKVEKEKQNKQENQAKPKSEEKIKTEIKPKQKQSINKTNNKEVATKISNQTSQTNAGTEKVTQDWTKADIQNIMKYQIDASPDDLKEISKEKAIKGIKAQFPELSKGIPDNLLALAGLEMYEATKHQDDINKVTYYVNRAKELLKQFHKNVQKEGTTGTLKQTVMKISNQDKKQSNVAKAEKESPMETLGEKLKEGALKALEFTPIGLIGKGISSLFSSSNEKSVKAKKESGGIFSNIGDKIRGELKELGNSQPLKTIGKLASHSLIGEAFSHLFGNDENDKKKTPPTKLESKALVKETPKGVGELKQFVSQINNKKEEPKEAKGNNVVSSNPVTQTTIINNYNVPLFNDGRTLSKAYSL